MGALKALKRALAEYRLLTPDVAYIEDDVLMKAILHPDAHEDGGLACNDKELLAEMRTCIMQWLKSIGRQILTGNLNLVNTTFPVDMFEPRSYLQKLADVMVFSQYLDAAASCTDPLERMKLLATYMVAGLHRGFETWKKPFNPILGETWQATLPGGLTLYMEQVSHHPPISAYIVEGPSGSWRFTGWSQPAVTPVVKYYGIKTMATGGRRLELADGTCIEMFAPYFAIKGVVYANKPRAEVLGSARIVDLANQLEAILHFGPVKGTRQRILERADAVVGEIYKLPASAASAAAAAAVSAGSNVFSSNWHHRGWVLGRTLTSATALSDAEEGSEAVAVDTCSSEDMPNDVDADDEAIFNAVHSQIGTAPVDADLGAKVAPALGVEKLAISNPAAAAEPKPGKFKRSLSSTLGSRGSHSSSSSGGRSLSRGDVGSCSMHAGHRGDVDVPGVAVAHLEGSWLSHLNIDNKRYWTWSEHKADHWEHVADPLPSDACKREDLQALARGDKAEAQRWKEALEQRQRADKKLREAAGAH